ncbi:hypothetical protein [Nocardiopsis sp. MG754419]|uniref:hypothetical protein n=1 Tax=Nocardiopsis sp. MG754419 TaxID=2259865 RepID=UPI001BA8A970|nr:hypothetical protein [Nocardiopsis sp. MG754419]MBR8743141.1 hypothetical protein [Nocardiopsis sp. MG754419]
MSESVRLVCPVGRKYVETWAGYALVILGLVAVAIDPGHWANITLGVLLVVGGAVSAVHGHLIKSPVLEIADGEFRYERGSYVVRIPFDEIGSYHLLPGRIRSLGLYDTTGRAKRFPSLAGRRTARSHLPLTGMVQPSRVESFMAVAGIPPRKRSLTS